jgi:hypothetical protein
LRTPLISSHIRSELETTGRHFTIVNGGDCFSTDSLADVHKPRLNSTVMRINLTASGFADRIFTGFLITIQLTCERIEFKCDGHCASRIIQSATGHFGDHLVNSVPESFSLEEVFLSATRRHTDSI